MMEYKHTLSHFILTTRTEADALISCHQPPPIIFETLRSIIVQTVKSAFNKIFLKLKYKNFGLLCQGNLDVGASSDCSMLHIFPFY